MQEVNFKRRTTADHANLYTNTPLKVMPDVTTRMVKTTIQYNTIQYNTIKYNAMQCNTTQVVLGCKVGALLFFANIFYMEGKCIFERLFKKKHKVEGQTYAVKFHLCYHSPKIFEMDIIINDIVC